MSIKTRLATFAGTAVAVAGVAFSAPAVASAQCAQACPPDPGETVTLTAIGSRTVTATVDYGAWAYAWNGATFTADPNGSGQPVNVVGYNELACARADGSWYYLRSDFATVWSRQPVTISVATLSCPAGQTSADGHMFAYGQERMRGGQILKTGVIELDYGVVIS